MSRGQGFVGLQAIRPSPFGFSVGGRGVSVSSPVLKVVRVDCAARYRWHREKQKCNGGWVMTVLQTEDLQQGRVALRHQPGSTSCGACTSLPAVFQPAIGLLAKLNRLVCERASPRSNGKFRPPVLPRFWLAEEYLGWMGTPGDVPHADLPSTSSRRLFEVAGILPALACI